MYCVHLQPDSFCLNPATQKFRWQPSTFGRQGSVWRLLLICKASKRIGKYQTLICKVESTLITSLCPRRTQYCDNGQLELRPISGAVIEGKERSVDGRRGEEVSECMATGLDHFWPVRSRKKLHVSTNALYLLWDRVDYVQSTPSQAVVLEALARRCLMKHRTFKVKLRERSKILHNCWFKLWMVSENEGGELPGITCSIFWFSAYVNLHRPYYALCEVHF